MKKQKKQTESERLDQAVPGTGPGRDGFSCTGQFPGRAYSIMEGIILSAFLYNQTIPSVDNCRHFAII